MENLIERYIHDVIRRLPENEQAEVGKELRANIYDMLPPSAGQNELEAILYKLGPPADLAEQYRQKPRYLISPAVYDDYVRVLKWLLPLVGLVLMGIGAVVGIVQSANSLSIEGAPELFSGIFSKAIGMGVSGAFQALVWATIGFAIADRAGAKDMQNKAREWKLEDLPEVPVNNKGKIPLSDTIAELVVGLIFTGIALLFCVGMLPITFIIQVGDTQIVNLFSQSFLAACIPMIAVTALLMVAEGVVKIKDRRWTPLVCGTVLASNAISLAITFYLVTRPEIFSPSFIEFLHNTTFGRLDLIRIMGVGGFNPILLIIVAISLAASVGESIVAIYKTLRYR